MRDHTGYLLTLILLLLFSLLLWGYTDWHKDMIRENLVREELEWKEVLRRSNERKCFREAYGELYLIENELQTVKAEIRFEECLN